MAASVGSRIKHFRKLNKVSAETLTAELTRLGVPMTRSVLANLETGRRPLVTLAEILAIASALDVPPIVLMLPFGEADQVEILPGRTVSVSKAADWICGEDDAASDDYRSAMAPLLRLRQYEGALAALAGRLGADMSLQEAREATPMIRDVQRARELMRAAGDPRPEPPEWYQALGRQLHGIVRMLGPLREGIRKTSEAIAILRERGVPAESLTYEALADRFGEDAILGECLEILLAETAPKEGLT